MHDSIIFDIDISQSWHSKRNSLTILRPLDEPKYSVIEIWHPVRITQTSLTLSYAIHQQGMMGSEVIWKVAQLDLFRFCVIQRTLTDQTPILYVDPKFSADHMLLIAVLCKCAEGHHCLIWTPRYITLEQIFWFVFLNKIM